MVPNDDATSNETSEASNFKPKGGSGSFRQGGTFPTAICLTKAAVGAGVLSIAAHSAEVGSVYTSVCLAIAGALTVVSIWMISEASIATGCWSFEDISEELFHPAMALWTGFINVCNCLGSGAGYLIVCGQVFSVLSGAGEDWRRRFVLLVGIFVCMPLALARHVSFMRHLAALSVAAICLLAVAVVVYLGEHGPDDSVTPETLWAGPGGATVMTYMNTVNIIIFAYNNQFNVPQLASELTPQPQVRRMTCVSAISTSICFALYSSVALFGVLAFGVEGNQKDTLVLDLYPARRSPLVCAALLGVMFSVLTCFQFHIYPIRQFLAYAIRKARGRDAGDEETDALRCGVSVTRWLDIICALGSVALALVVAVSITQLKPVLDFVGAFAGAWVSYVVPPLFVLQLRRRQPGFTWANAEALFCLAFSGLGAFLFVFGTYAAIVG